MTAPWVGPPSDEYRAVCVYAEEPGATQCSAPATLHVKVDDPGYGTAALSTCDQHAPIARGAGQFIEEHTYEGFCDIAGSIWVDNQCVLDVSGVEPVRRAKAVISA